MYILPVCFEYHEQKNVNDLLYPCYEMSESFHVFECEIIFFLKEKVIRRLNHEMKWNVLGNCSTDYKFQTKQDLTFNQQG